MISQSKSVEIVKTVNLSGVAATAANRVFAAVFLVYLAPLMLAVAFVIKMDSRGPALLRRDRRLANGDIVELWEFRTTAGITGNATALGAFLRETHLDRLPRLINMLGGDISIQAFLR